MARKRAKIKQIIVRISSKARERPKPEPQEHVKSQEHGMEKFFINVLKPLQPVQPLQTLQPLQPWPLEPRTELGLRELRQVASEEKARLLAMIKEKKPVSLYALAKLLGRDFKAVRQDVKLLEKFGLVRLVPERDAKTRKKRLKPILAIDKLQITIEL